MLVVSRTINVSTHHDELLIVSFVCKRQHQRNLYLQPRHSMPWEGQPWHRVGPYDMRHAIPVISSRGPMLDDTSKRTRMHPVLQRCMRVHKLMMQDLVTDNKGSLSRSCELTADTHDRQREMIQLQPVPVDDDDCSFKITN